MFSHKKMNFRSEFTQDSIFFAGYTMRKFSNKRRWIDVFLPIFCISNTSGRVRPDVDMHLPFLYLLENWPGKTLSPSVSSLPDQPGRLTMTGPSYIPLIPTLLTIQFSLSTIPLRTVIPFISKAAQGVQGSLVYTLADAPGTQVIYQAVYYPAVIGNTHWSIIVATPDDEILSTLYGLRNSLLVICGILVISLFFFTYYTMRAWGISQGRRESEDCRSCVAGK